MCFYSLVSSRTSTSTHIANFRWVHFCQHASLPNICRLSCSKIAWTKSAPMATNRWPMPRKGIEAGLTPLARRHAPFTPPPKRPISSDCSRQPQNCLSRCWASRDARHNVPHTPHRPLYRPHASPRAVGGRGYHHVLRPQSYGSIRGATLHWWWVPIMFLSF